MLVKLTCRGRDFATAVNRAKRAVAEFRIRGVSTNIPFLQAVLDDPDFQAGRITTSFIDERPHLLTARMSADRGTKMLKFLAEVTVNSPYRDRPRYYPQDKLPAIDLAATSPPPGSKQRLDELGPEGFARWLKDSPAVGVTDTTFRDAHQSLLATRVRSSGLLAVAPYIARMIPQLLSIECWGGATYDVALRFLKEDPWERLSSLREALPNICLQMLLRGRNTVGYTPYPELVTHAFVEEAARTGVDIFRIFDALNNVESMRPAIDAVRETGTAVAEVAMSYTGDLSNPGETLYTLDYWLRLAEQIVEAGAHVLAIKDMAGLLRPPAAAALVSALRSRFDLPIHVHTHDTAGGQLATYTAAWHAGASAVDGRRRRCPAPPVSHRSRLSSPPPRTPLRHRPGPECGLRPRAVLGAAAKGVRPVRSRPTRAHRAGLPPRDPRWAAEQSAHPGDRAGTRRPVRDIEDAYAGADHILGRLVKVTPSSKVVGDLALALVGAGITAAEFAEDPARHDIPDSVIGFLRGELGDPPGGWPEPLRTKALEGRGRPSRSSRCRPRMKRCSPNPVPPAEPPSTACCSPGPPGSSRPTARSTATHPD